MWLQSKWLISILTLSLTPSAFAFCSNISDQQKTAKNEYHQVQSTITAKSARQQALEMAISLTKASTAKLEERISETKKWNQRDQAILTDVRHSKVFLELVKTAFETLYDLRKHYRRVTFEDDLFTFAIDHNLKNNPKLSSFRETPEYIDLELAFNLLLSASRNQRQLLEMLEDVVYPAEDLPNTTGDLVIEFEVEAKNLKIQTNALQNIREQKASIQRDSENREHEKAQLALDQAELTKIKADLPRLSARLSPLADTLSQLREEMLHCNLKTISMRVY